MNNSCNTLRLLLRPSFSRWSHLCRTSRSSSRSLRRFSDPPCPPSAGPALRRTRGGDDAHRFPAHDPMNLSSRAGVHSDVHRHRSQPRSFASELAHMTAQSTFLGGLPDSTRNCRSLCLRRRTHTSGRSSRARRFCYYPCCLKGNEIFKKIIYLTDILGSKD